MLLKFYTHQCKPSVSVNIRSLFSSFQGKFEFNKTNCVNMKYNLFQKLTVAALVSLLVLIFMGATVRVTGAGMGCPDWPTCWGLLIPPTHVDQVDFSKLPIEKFQKKAERMGRDPKSITADRFKNEFNPRNVWTVFINRLCSLPVGFFSLASC